METGETSQPKKAKAPYQAWTHQESQMLKALLVDAIKRGWCDVNGSISKATVETKILPALNKKLKCDRTYKNYTSRMKSLKKEYSAYSELFRFSSGFGWDPITKQFTASDDVWKEYLKGHPNHHYMRDNTFEDFEDLQMIFESAIARGNNAFGLGGGDSLIAETFEEENDFQARDDVNNVENVDEMNEATPPKEKLPPRKRAKTNGNGEPSESTNYGDSSEKVLAEMIGVSTNIINLIQQREERHRRESELKEIEKKKTNIWDAIKEIPDLEEHIRYDAVTKIHTLKMKDVFVSMSVEERLGWIRRNVT